MVLVAGEASGLQQSRAMEGEGVITRTIDQLRGGQPGQVGATCKWQEAWLRIWNWHREESIGEDVSPSNRFLGVKVPSEIGKAQHGLLDCLGSSSDAHSRQLPIT